MTTALELHLRIVGRHDLAGQVYRQLRSAIDEGRLADGTRLPSTRDLAIQLCVSRKTTLEAFDRLIAEGYLLTRRGEGTYVQASPLAAIVEPPAILARLASTSAWDALHETLAMQRPRDRVVQVFPGGVTDRGAFPFAAWRRCLMHALRIMARGNSSYRNAAGEEELRLAISRYLAVSRGLHCPWQAVMVTQGAQQALDLLARTVINPGDQVAMEEPGYPPARACFLAAGARVVAVPVDDDGLCVDALPENVRVVYTTPAHQFPLGMAMAPARRDALLRWARKRNVLLIEDDYDGEYRFEGRPLNALKAEDTADNVAYVGTFSKTIFPELRIGYVVAPVALQVALHKARQASDWHGCMLTQLALARFMLDGDFALHQRRMLKLYAKRRLALAAAFAGPLAPWFHAVPAVAGIHMTALLRAPLTEALLIEAAQAKGIGLMGLAPFHAGAPGRQGIVFGYGATSLAEIDSGVAMLLGLLNDIRSAVPG